MADFMDQANSSLAGPLQWAEIKLPDVFQRVAYMAYDASNKLFLAIDDNSLAAYHAPWQTSLADVAVDEPEWLVDVEDLPENLAALTIACSLTPATAVSSPDVRPRNPVVGMLEGNRVVHCVDADNGNTFVQGVYKKAPRHLHQVSVLGFFWTVSPRIDFVLVTTAGMQPFKMVSQGLEPLKIWDAQPLQRVTWYKYQHDTRLAILGNHQELWIFQLTSVAPYTELPPVPLAEIFGSPQAAEQHFDPRNLHIVRMHHSSMFVCIVDPLGVCVHVLRLVKDAAQLLGVLPLTPSSGQLRPGSVQCSVVDNMLALVFLDTGLVSIFDLLMTPASQGSPNTPPTWHAVLEHEPIHGAKSDKSGNIRPLLPDDLTAPIPTFLPASLVYDRMNRTAYRLRMDVKAVLEKSHLPPHFKFQVLSRRDKRLGSWLKECKTQILRSVCQERAPVAQLRLLFDSINRDFITAQEELGVDQAMPAHILTPSDTVSDVLLWLHNEEAVPAPYLQAMVLQFRVSACVLRVQLPMLLDQLLLDTVLEQDHFFQAEQLMRGMQPRWGDPAMIKHIEAAVASPLFSGIQLDTSQLWARSAARNHAAGNRRASLGANAASERAVADSCLEAYVRSKLQDGHVIDAARAIVASPTVPHAKTLNDLNAAAMVQAPTNPALFTSVYRCCDALTTQRSPHS